MKYERSIVSQNDNCCPIIDFFLAMLSLYLEMITSLIKIVENVSEVQDKSQNSEI